MAALQNLCKHVQLLRLNVRLLIKEDTTLPAFKGAMWHGWLGQCLQQYDGSLYQVFFGEHDAMHPKPYCLVPAADHKLHWHAGEVIEFELKLFGHSINLAQKLISALNEGCSRGIGERRAPVELLSISSQTTHGEYLGLHSQPLDDYLKPAVAVEQLLLHLRTPMRLKQHGQVLRELHSARIIVQNSCRRLCEIARYWAVEDNELLDRVQIETPRGHELRFRSSTYYEDWKRFSHKSQNKLPFGGVKGTLLITGDLTPYVPYLNVGEQLQIGGKTTFGLGCFSAVY